MPPGAAKRQADPPKLPAATTGFLTVETEPPTRIFLAGKMIGRTPLLRAEVPSGIWEVTARNEVEGVTTTWTISVATGAEVRRAVQFRMGKIAVRVRPYGEIFIDGKSFGVAPIPPVELYEGVRRVRVLGPEGTRPYDKQVEIRAGETTVVNIDLAR